MKPAIILGCQVLLIGGALFVAFAATAPNPKQWTTDKENGYTLKTNVVPVVPAGSLAPVLQTNVVLSQKASFVPKTNPPPYALTLAWTPSDSNWANFTVYDGPASGMWDMTNVVKTNEITFTNYPLHPLVFAVSETDSNGQFSPLSSELWLGAPSNGTVYTYKGAEYLGFEVASNNTYQARGVMGTPTNSLGSYTATSNAFVQMPLPKPGFYRLTRVTN